MVDSGTAALAVERERSAGAKRSKDFATADQLRDELRAGGVDPEKARPAGPDAGPAKRQRTFW